MFLFYVANSHCKTQHHAHRFARLNPTAAFTGGQTYSLSLHYYFKQMYFAAD